MFSFKTYFIVALICMPLFIIMIAIMRIDLIMHYFTDDEKDDKKENKKSSSSEDAEKKESINE